MRSTIKRLSIAAIVVGSCVMMAAPASASSPHGQDAPKSVVSAYFADWDVYGRGYYVKDIPAESAQRDPVRLRCADLRLRPPARWAAASSTPGRTTSRSTGPATTPLTASPTTRTTSTSTCSATSTSCASSRRRTPG